MDDEQRYGSGAAVHRGYEGEDRAMPDQEAPEARQAMERLFMGAEAIHGQVNALEERLHDLLGPERPSPDGMRGEVRAVRTTMGGRLHEVADQLAHAERRLADLHDRLRDGI